jgi:hypothetical protein
MLRHAIPFGLLAATKLLSHAFYRLNTQWVGDARPEAWDDVRVIILLNHTSLFEPLYAQAMPWSFIGRFSRRGVFPAADVTLARPIAGRIIKMLAPEVAPLTRKRDESWSGFMRGLRQDAILIFVPEGRMKRRDGRDKDGKPMTVRAGIADVLAQLGTGTMLIAYSGGLHHVQAPGEGLPRVFKPLHVALEALKIEEYLGAFPPPGTDGFKVAVAKDLDARRDRHAPSAT